MKKYNYSFLVMPKHLNPCGSLFGGQLFSWIDESVYMAVRSKFLKSSVTAKVENFQFLKGAELNDLINIIVDINLVGRSSCSCDVKAYRGDSLKEEIASSQFVMVGINNSGEKINLKDLNEKTYSNKSNSHLSTYKENLTKAYLYISNKL